MNKYLVTKAYPITSGTSAAMTTATYNSFVKADYFTTDKDGYLRFGADPLWIAVYAPGEWSHVNLIQEEEGNT